MKLQIPEASSLCDDDGDDEVRDADDEVPAIPISGWKFGVGDGKWKEDATLMLNGTYIFLFFSDKLMTRCTKLRRSPRLPGQHCTEQQWTIIREIS